MNPAFLARRFAVFSVLLFMLALSPISHAQLDENQPGENRSIDQRLEEARKEGQISGAFDLNRNLDAYDLKVEVRGRKAVLSGNVEEESEKELAEQIALHAGNVDSVDNRIRVTGEGARSTSRTRTFGQGVRDATISASIKSRLLWNRLTHGLDINVTTREGRVTLTGTVASARERELAAALAADTADVRSIDNRLQVAPEAAGAGQEMSSRSTQATGATENEQPASEQQTPPAVETEETAKNRFSSQNQDSEHPVSDAWITSKVKASLLFSKNLRSSDVDVNTTNGVVTLNGSVPSQAERERVIEITKDIRGVKNVQSGGLKVITAAQ